MRRQRYIFAWICGLTLGLAACTAVTGGEATVLPTRTVTAVAPTATPTPPSPTPAPLCTPPACAEGEVYFCPGDCPGGCGTVCATPTPDNIGPAPTTWAELETWLVQAYQEKLPPETIISHLFEVGWLREDERSPDYEYWTIVDLDGDSESEWVFSLHILPDQFEYLPYFPVGNLWIIGKRGVIYRHYDEVPYDAADFYYPLPKLVGINDMVGNGLPNLIVKTQICGAHTCVDSYHILQSVSDTVKNIVSRPGSNKAIKGITYEEDVISVTFSDIHFEDYQGDGRLDLFVHGGEIGSVGAGLVRPYTQVWSWDGTAVTLADTVLDPTGYRHHILYEANDAFATADLDRALALYEQAINDPGLLTPPPLGEGTEADVQAAIHQFVAFRLILLDLWQGDRPRAEGRLSWLEANYANTPITQAAQQLLANWTGEGDPLALCDGITAVLQTSPNPTGLLENMGYGNPSLTAVDVCPSP